jgi:spore germination cell wall hydrolase CwlJ-like protein
VRLALLESPVQMSPDDQYWVNVVFLALAVWREASNQTFEAKLAVAFVVCARAIKGGWWGATIMGVIAKKEQFSSMTHIGDPNLVRWPQPTDYAWTDSINAAKQAIAKSAANPAPNADSYLDTSIPLPTWAEKATFIAQIDQLKFFRTV